MIELAACPECGVPAEIQDRAAWESTDSPIEHVRLVYARRHRFVMPVEGLTRVLARTSAPVGGSSTTRRVTSGGCTVTPAVLQVAGLVDRLPRRVRRHRPCPLNVEGRYAMTCHDLPKGLRVHIRGPEPSTTHHTRKGRDWS